MLSGSGQKITRLLRQFKIDNPSPHDPERVKELRQKCLNCKNKCLSVRLCSFNATFSRRYTSYFRLRVQTKWPPRMSLQSPETAVHCPQHSACLTPRCAPDHCLRTAPPKTSDGTRSNCRPSPKTSETTRPPKAAPDLIPGLACRWPGQEYAGDERIPLWKGNEVSI